MTKKEWECIGFGFGAAVVLGVATWGALELAKKAVAAIREKGLQPCCCDEVEEDDLVEKSVNAQDEIVSPEFDRNAAETE